MEGEEFSRGLCRLKHSFILLPIAHVVCDFGYSWPHVRGFSNLDNDVNLILTYNTG